MAKRKQILRVEISNITTNSSWRNASLSVQDYRRNSAVVIELCGPSDVAYLREQLQKIEDGWRRELEILKP